MKTYILQLSGGVSFPRWQLDITADNDHDACVQAERAITRSVPTEAHAATLWRKPAQGSVENEWPLVASFNIDHATLVTKR